MGRADVVRVGDTVRRLSHARSGYVDALLEHLHSRGFGGAPRALGYDDAGRQVVSFIPGEVVVDGPYELSQARVSSAIRLVRQFHDATVSFPLLEGGDVVCHHDLGPHNTVFRGEDAVALIDFDADVGPGRRFDDLAHAAWGFADLVDERVAVAEQARRLRVVCENYPGATPEVLVQELGERFERALARHAAAGRSGAVEVFEQLREGLARTRDELLGG